MKAFLEVIKLQFKVYIQYRWSFGMALFIQPFILLINIALFTSIYAYNNTDTIKGYTLEQMIWYMTAISFVMAFMVNFADSRLSQKILSGELTMDLLRPMSYFRYELAVAIALRSVGVIMEFVPGIVIYSLIFYPQFLTIFSVSKFIIVAILAFFLFFLINFLIGLLAFAITSNSSISNIKLLVVFFLGGAIIPLEFFPKSFNQVAAVLPFKYMLYMPVQIFLNKEFVRGTEAFIQIIGVQLLWTLFFYVCCKVLWRVAIRKFCAAGG